MCRKQKPACSEQDFKQSSIQRRCCSTAATGKPSNCFRASTGCLNQRAHRKGATEQMKKTAAIYVRVSTPDQHVESQLYDLRQLALDRGFEVVQEYCDWGVSGRKARRPGLDTLMADARRKKFSVVLVAAFDRMARGVKH